MRLNRPNRNERKDRSPHLRPRVRAKSHESERMGAKGGGLLQGGLPWVRSSSYMRLCGGRLAQNEHGVLGED